MRKNKFIDYLINIFRSKRNKWSYILLRNEIVNFNIFYYSVFANDNNSFIRIIVKQNSISTTTRAEIIFRLAIL